MARHMTQRYAKIDRLQLRIVVMQNTTHYSARIIIDIQIIYFKLFNPKEKKKP